MGHGLFALDAANIRGMAKKKRGRARERGESVPFTFELSPALYAALDKCRKRDVRTKTAVLTLALQEYLQARGLWPPEEEVSPS